MSFTCYDSNGHPFQTSSLADCLGKGFTVPPSPFGQPQGPQAGIRQSDQQVGQTASNIGTTVHDTVNNATGGWTAAQHFFTWFSSPDHWKGVGLIVAASVLGIVGLVLWTGKGQDVVRVSTTTGMRALGA